MRKMMKSWRFRIGVLVLVCIALYPTAYLLLPRTADGVSVTVVQCATVQPPIQDFGQLFDCQGTTVFQQTFTDEATVSAVHATLDGLHEENPVFANVNCNAGSECAPTQVYSFDLLWHGSAVRSYLASVHNGYRIFWAVRTLGVELPTMEGPTTWQELTRLTGMPVVPTAVP